MLARLVAFLALVQPPAPPAPESHVPLRPVVTDPEVRRTAALFQLLRAARGEGLLGDPKLRELIKKTIADNPGMDQNALARKVLDQDSKYRDNPVVKAWLKQAGESAPAPAAGPGPGRPTAQPPATPPANRQTPTPATEAAAPTPSAAPNPPAGQPGPAPAGPPPRADRIPRRPSIQQPGTPQPVTATPANGDLEAAGRQTQADQRSAAFTELFEKHAWPLAQTPAFKEVVEQFIRGGAADGRQTGDSPLNSLLSAGSDAAGAAGWIERNVGSLSFDTPSRPRSDLSVPSFGTPSLPDTGGLALPGAPSTLALAMLVLGVAAAAWWAWRRRAGERARREVGRAAAWPVNPNRLRTREELVLAFDHLGLVALGMPARHWHHRAVAAGLAARSPGDAAAANDLADLYELARYAPAADPFPLDRLPAAGASVAKLAGPA